MKKYYAKYNKSILIGFLLFLLITLGVFGWERHKKETYQILFLGDSNIGNVRDETGIVSLLEQELSVKIYNGAFGGSTAAYYNREGKPTRTGNTVTLTGLSQALVRQDFSMQNAGILYWYTMDYMPEAVYGFQYVNIDTLDIILIEHGVNDYMLGVPLDNKEDPYDVYTFGGALRTSLSDLQKRYPEKEIILCTPTYCWFPEEGMSCEEKEYGQGILEDYVNLEITIAEEYQIGLIDNYHESGIGGEFEDWELYTEDGLHLNEKGRAIIADNISDYLKEQK